MSNTDWRKIRDAVCHAGFCIVEGGKHDKVMTLDGRYICPIDRAGRSSGCPEKFLAFRTTFRRATGIDIRKLLAG